MSWETRFKSKVQINVETNCWIWTGSLFKTGYGSFYKDGKTTYAHRIAYELWKEIIPSGLHIDHLCRHRACVNPDHLEAVPQAENTRRGLAEWPLATINRKKVHCPLGHPLSGSNLYQKPDGRRCCRTCRQDQQRERRAIK